jgi:UDP-glucose 4-epimerase
MKYLVTGGAGFIGSHLTDALLDAGHTVIVLDNFSLGSHKNLERHNGNPRLIVYEKDIRSDLAGVFATQGISAVFHLAAIPRARYSVIRPAETHAVNVEGTFNLLEQARAFGVKRFIFSSSAAIYGERDRIPLSEDVSPEPVSPYALQKLIGEQYCALFHRLYGLETIALRYFNVYGPRQNPSGDYSCLIPKFITLLCGDQRPHIYGDGEQTRDFVYVSDVIRANITAAETQNKECFGQVCNVGTGMQTSVNDVTRSLVKVVGKAIDPVYGPAFLEPRISCASIEKIKQHLGWSPEVLFDEGLQRTFHALSPSKPTLTTEPYFVSR